MGIDSTSSGPAPGGPGSRLDVSLRSAREHAIKDVLAWVVALGAVAAFLSAFGSAVGWPDPDFRVKAHAVGFEAVHDGTIVEFRGSGGGVDVRWTRHVETNGWEFGEPTEGWVDDGLFYSDHGPSFTGPADFVLLLAWAGLAAWAVRRWVAVELAVSDASRGKERPRHGYVAMVDNPLPRTWRDVLLVWHDQPLKPEGGLAVPDETLLADDDVGSKHGDPGVVRLWEAWVDTGRTGWSKTRWVAVRDGVFVPHRRALIVGHLAYAHAERLDVLPPVPYEDPPAEGTSPHAPRHHFVKMLAWRLVAVVVLAAVSVYFLDPGERVTIIG